MIGVVLVGMRDDWLGWNVGMDGIVEMVGWMGWMHGWMDNGRSLKCGRSLLTGFGLKQPRFFEQGALLDLSDFDFPENLKGVWKKNDFWT